MKIYSILKHYIGLSLVLTLIVHSGCKKFVDVGAPENRIGIKESFANEAGATSAILGLYAQNLTGSQGLIRYYSACMGNSADELKSTSDAFNVFGSNAVPVNSFYVSEYLWYTSYKQIMLCNQAIEGLETSAALRPSVKSSLTGEAKFWRAFIYFYLTNMFGDVPMPLGTNALENSRLPRTPAAQVWTQIITDLKDAEAGLAIDYPGTGFRTRVSKSVAEAFLARVYLYQKDWYNAEAYSTKLIEGGYLLLDKDNIDGVFTNTSEETIFQIANMTGVSSFGPLYVSSPGIVPILSMTDDLNGSFSNSDLRKINWTRQNTANGQQFTEIYKYKTRIGSGAEYDIVFRLAEQLLIRAEARAHLNKITGPNSALSDLNEIKDRAELPKVLVASQSDILFEIEQERRHELFGEFGHRWLDLKRTPSTIMPATPSRADDLFSQSKPGWKSTAKLYPIPASQRAQNTNLTQNEGYTP
ncbi:RagB/SusD family nutrient uptake outer membrane protein [Pedobacter rhizosphaerae]|uniref:SusD family protein n=1 Tax=Pedobacter rhizosphaerae TaxID=390241 RepID=A0A1H9SSN2_9SPHI|nr:RagB/SusD family nutrient uptake outer membrane protein [Pedobacter rhizosphaerae]SER87878.1 SusD family protein [Pedobacter rhizosphaerae]